MYLTGDGAETDDRGFFQITGRVDDVINVSGHRLGTAEIEDALVDVHFMFRFSFFRIIFVAGYE